jgi:carbonic anhydrase/acetyltransferase-like protein (isoleucine patch superfamily)
MFIFGTGAHARKVFHCAVECGYQVAAFIDENPPPSAPVAGVPVLDAKLLPAPGANDCAFIAIGRADVRRRLMDSLAAKGWSLPALVHKSAWVAPDARLSAGVLVAAGAVVETATVIGRGAIVDIGVLVDHECDVGAFSHLRPGDVLGPRTQLAEVA